MLKGNQTELQNFPLHKNKNLMVRRSNRSIQVNVVQFVTYDAFDVTFSNLWNIREK